MRLIATEIEIAAPKEKVWSILSKTGEYEEWNPFIKSITGNLTEGGKLSVVIEPPGGKPMTFRPAIIEHDEPRQLRWLGRVLFPGLFDGEHRFALEPLDESRVKLIQEEKFTGILVPILLTRAMERRTTEGFRAMNQALKERAEIAHEQLD